ncbi:MAG TPA: hypothetical protein VF791_20020 [Pyrinomonadaceae bacterium]
MRQSEFFNRQSSPRLIALAILATLTTLLFLDLRESSTAAEPAQRNRQQSQRRRRPATQRPAATTGAARKYSRFQHDTHLPKEGRRTSVEAGKLKCATCHVIPSASPFAEKPEDPLAKIKDVAAATKPGMDGYPYHDSCVRCHRTEFFKGANPPICLVCHTASNPKLTARNMFSFPKQDEQAMEREFPGYFPHKVHQDVIARNEQPDEAMQGLLFVRASFRSPADTPPSSAADNCAFCHATDKRKSPDAGLLDAAAKDFKIPEGTFKSLPSGHASCFNCHWESQQPTRNDCEGCHRRTDGTVKETLSSLSVDDEKKIFGKWPSQWPRRFALKFNHESVKKETSKKNHDLGCTTCHVNILALNTLNIRKAGVKITACAQCHIQTYAPEINAEMSAEKVDIEAEEKNSGPPKQGTHTCAGCHTEAIGKMPPPCDHYLVLGKGYLQYKKVAERCMK